MKTHFYYLSAFRLVAAIFVLICHARCQLFVSYPELNEESHNIFTQLFFGGVGWTSEALAIFFVLSGFLVGGPQLYKLYLETQKDNRVYTCRLLAHRFIVGRVTRIIVPLFFAILFAAIVKIVGGIRIDWVDAVLNLLGLQGVLAHDFGEVFWTLAYEIWFYVLVAGIILLFCGKQRIILGILLVLFSFFVFVKLPACWFFMFLIGIGLYFIKNLSFPRLLLWISVSGVFIIKVLSTLSIESHVFRFPLYGLLNGSMLNISLALCLGIIMTMLVNIVPRSPFAKKIERIGNKYCVSTYCLYITHFTVLELFKHIFGQMKDVNALSLVIYILMCLFCLLFGYAFYWFFEHKLGNYLKSIL